MQVKVADANIDHCRIGSLEINAGINPLNAGDHCRIGSLEIMMLNLHSYQKDHCRIGSLESSSGPQSRRGFDHCRIGSLEIDTNEILDDEAEITAA